MRKLSLMFLAVAFFLVSVYAYADQTLNGRQAREWSLSTQSNILHGTDDSGDATAFTNVVVTGHQAKGNPGFIALVSTNGNTYYLWVDDTRVTNGPGSTNGVGTLLMASFASLNAVANAASFPYGDWRSSTGFVSWVVVGNQS